MNEKTKIILVCIILAIALPVGGLYAVFNYKINELPPEPQEYVNEIVVEDNAKALYREKIIRYPAKGAVMPAIPNKTMSLGLSVDRDMLNFGLITSGLIVNKALEFRNEEEYPAKVRIVAYGSLKPYIMVDENNFILNSKEGRAIAIKMNASEVGEFSGEIDVIMRIPKYPQLVFMMQ